jgi:polysaccharide biosynthesis transport protein
VPVQPRPSLILTIAALLGLVVGVLGALVLERRHSGLDEPEDLMDVTNVPVLANIPEARSMRRGRTLAWDDSELREVHEAFRFLRTSLLMSTAPHGLLQVTSLESGQGKSSVVANLGVAIAQLGREVVIVDADLRRPVQHTIFGVSSQPGFSNLLVQRDLDFEPIPTRFRGLSIIPAGALLPNPTELLHVRLAAVAADLRQEGRIVLFDSPPLVPVSDARLLSRVVDGVILVVDAGSQAQSLGAALEQLRQTEAPVLGTVFNRSESKGDSYSPYLASTGVPVGGASASR